MSCKTSWVGRGVLIAFFLAISARLEADGPGPSIVQVDGRQLIVQKRNPDGSLQPPAPYVIRGVNWSPASAGTAGDRSSRRAELANWYLTDIPLLQAMNVNTVRVYLDPGFDASALAVLDELWAHDIMVVMTVDDAVNDLTRVQQAVSFYKDHPAILMWMLGSEWNINLYFGNPSCNTALKAAQCTQAAAQLVKSLDTTHPVATSYGDIEINAPGMHLADTQNYVNNICTSVDIWSLNIFRGDTFGTLFDQWQSITTRPMFIGELGTDALRYPGNILDETMQAGWDLCLWNDLINELATESPSLPGQGGLIFEWNDEWWKVSPSGIQNTGGFSSPNGHPDGFANEEYFGLVTIDRTQRHAASALAPAFTDAHHAPPGGLVLGTGSRGGAAAQYSGQYGYSRFYRCGRTFYDKNGGGGGGRGFNVVALDPVTGAELSPPQNFDTYSTRSQCAANSPGAQMYAMVSFLNSLPNGTVVMISVADEAGLNQDLSCNRFSTSSCYESGYAALEALGSTQIRSYCFRDSWALIAVKGQGALAEGRSSGQLVSLLATLPDPGSFALTLDKAGAGTGTVTSDPAGIDCGAACATDTGIFETGRVVTLTLVAAPGSTFLGWSGDPDCANGVIAIDADRSCTATFDLIPPQALTVTKAGTGDGVVVSSPPGVDCGVDCSEDFAYGTVVNLTATADGTSQFTSWSGACSGTGACSVTMDAAKAVTATFTQIRYDLTVAKAGTGGGVVTSSPVGINCGTDCSESYVKNTVVNLTATPDGTSQFTSWSGACSGTGACSVTMDAAKAVTATFTQIRYDLTVAKAGTGGGVVTSAPTGINCGTDCSESYVKNTVVNLTATPDGTSQFTSWSGACSGTGACSVTMDAAKAVTATFTQIRYDLTVAKAGTGDGVVTSAPTGINCGTDCSESYVKNTAVNLTATPDGTSQFTSWSGACSGTGACSVTMDAAKSVTATFTQIRYDLTVAKAGTGGGVVTSAPTGINCGTDCSESYVKNTVVNLTATPDGTSQFTSWSGACSGAGACSVTMDAAKSVTATFTQIRYDLTVAKAGTGGGVVTSAPTGINCGTDCSESYVKNTVVNLTATPDGTSQFTSWSGACSGTGACSVTLDAAKAVTATFTQIRYDLTVAKAGTGGGVVTSSPTGINCGTDCSESYVKNTVVNLTATPDGTSQFTSWSGGCSGTGACSVTMDAAKAVTATFEKLPGLDFYTLSPCRVVDTRTDSPIDSGVTRVFPITGICGVPLDAQAISINVTVFQPSASGQVTLFPGDVPAPDTNTLSFHAGQNRANNAVLALSADGQGSIAALATLNTQGQVHLIVDVNGYFQ